MTLERHTVATGETPFHDNDLLTFPGVQDGHSLNLVSKAQTTQYISAHSDCRSRFECNRVDGVISANNKCHVSVLEIFVYLVHFQHNWITFN